MVFLYGCGQTSQTKTVSSATAIPPSAPAPARSTTSDTLAAGTSISAEIAEVLDSEVALDTAFVVANIARDVNGSNGGLAIPANSTALLVIRDASKKGTISRIVLGLNRMQVGSKVFKLGEGVKDMATLVIQQDSAKGGFHRSVHLEKQSLLTFRLDKAIQLQ